MSGRLQSTIQHYRDALNRHETQAEQTLERAYSYALKQIQPRLDKLLSEIAAKQANGEVIPHSWLYEAGRLQAIQRLIINQINQFAVYSQQTTKHLQDIGVQYGKQAGLSLLDASTPIGIDWAWGVPSPHALVSLVGATQEGSPLAKLFSGFGEEAAKGVTDALLMGLTNGSNPRMVARQVQQELGVSRSRALTIAANEMMRAYRSASQSVYRANASNLRGWKWNCAKSSRTCIVCLMMDGTEHPLSEEFGSHVRCRCAPIPLTKSWEEILGDAGIESAIPETMFNVQSGEEWFNDQSYDVQRGILGDAKYAKWQDGAFQLSDLIGHSHDAEWGHSIYERSLDSILKGG